MTKKLSCGVTVRIFQTPIIQAIQQKMPCRMAVTIETNEFLSCKTAFLNFASPETKLKPVMSGMHIPIRIAYSPRLPERRGAEKAM
jgi:hypothetical protein